MLPITPDDVMSLKPNFQEKPEEKIIIECVNQLIINNWDGKLSIIYLSTLILNVLSKIKNNEKYKNETHEDLEIIVKRWLNNGKILKRIYKDYGWEVKCYETEEGFSSYKVIRFKKYESIWLKIFGNKND